MDTQFIYKLLSDDKMESPFKYPMATKKQIVQLPESQKLGKLGLGLKIPGLF